MQAPFVAWRGKFEGLVAKDLASPYRGRTLAWLKMKVPRYREGKRGGGPRPAGDRS